MVVIIKFDITPIFLVIFIGYLKFIFILYYLCSYNSYNKTLLQNFQYYIYANTYVNNHYFYLIYNFIFFKYKCIKYKY